MDEGFFVILALLVPPLLALGSLALATLLAQAAAAARSSSRPSTSARCSSRRAWDWR